MASKKDDKKLLQTARDRFKRCVEADESNRRLAIDDLKFLHEPGAQWDQALKDERGTRPCYEFNKLRVSVKRVINDIRANRPMGKVRAVEDGDKPTSSVMEGLCRNVWNVSDGDSAVDNAAEYSVGGGLGAWRLNTKYSTDDAWDQDIVLEAIRNPFALWADPAARDIMKRDAEFWFLESRMSKDSYEAKYGKVPSAEWDSSEFDDDEMWEDDDRVRICEYWYRKPVTKQLALLMDPATGGPGKTVDMAEAQGIPPDMIMRQRTVQTQQICMIIMSGDKVLEGPVEWAGARFPFVQVYGEHVVIDGKMKWWGLARHSKDAQRLHNFMLTNAAETAANSPQQKWWATAEQANGHWALWAKAYKENLPFLTYNPDPMAPGAPPQMAGSQIPAAFVQLAMITGDEIKATTGIFDASLGSKSNETTGVAIRQRQQQGEIANFNYSDNIARGIRYTWELLLDLIPHIYDTARTVRVIGTDGAEDYAKINSVGPDGQPMNDLSRGKYDVTITVGPSFSTQRQEAAETYMGMAQADPGISQIAGDLIFKAIDLPYADEIADRIRVMLPPPIQQMLQQKSQAGGKELPPEARQALAQADQAMQMVQQHGQLVQQAEQELQGEKAEVEKAKGELHKMMADLKVQEANLKVFEAQLDAKIIEANAHMAEREAGVQSQAKDVEHAGSQMEQNAMQMGQQSAAEMVQEALQQVTEQIKNIEHALKNQPTPTIVMPAPAPRVKGVKKVNGGHQVEYDD